MALNRWQKVAFVILLIAIALFAVSFAFPSKYEICSPNEYTRAKECPQYHLGPYVFLWIVSVADAHNGLLTAIATIFVARFTIVLARVTGRQAQLTRESIDLARDEFNATHRPQIIVRGFQIFNGLPETSDDTVDVICVAHNKGDAPGTIIEIRSAKIILDSDEKIPGDWTFPFTEKFNFQLASGERELIPLNGALIKNNHEVMGILFQERTLYCVGTVVYVDAGKRRRETGFCRRFDPISETWEAVECEYEYAY
ncbi:MAG: hypothetical protein ABSC72_12080 [Methylovirgula sp.]|jgi:hypothetical protein